MVDVRRSVAVRAAAAELSVEGVENACPQISDLDAAEQRDDVLVGQASVDDRCLRHDLQQVEVAVEQLCSTVAPVRGFRCSSISTIIRRKVFSASAVAVGPAGMISRIVPSFAERIAAHKGHDAQRPAR